jgi:Na+-transporting methylmalonyl-CoA/oxaloacetate decarboxylase gamma subunit
MKRLMEISYAAKMAFVLVIAFFLIAVGLVVNYAITEHLIDDRAVQQKTEIAQSKADEDAAIKAAVAYSDKQWCGALALLTSHPTPKPSDPAANPSREGEYLFYEQLLNIKTKYRC